MLSKKAQQTGSQAAIVVAIITLLIVFYIMFLPPEDRCSLLGGSACSGSSSGGSTFPRPDGSSQVAGDTILSVSPGKFDYQSLDAYEYDLPAFSLYQTESASVLASGGNFYIKRGWFENLDNEFSFEVDDPDLLSDVRLAMTFGKFKGILTITLNDNQIYNYELEQGNLDPIVIKTEDLYRGRNVLKFSVSSVGLKFWTTNQYYVDNLEVTSKVHDYSKSESQLSFYISPDEGKNIEKATLKFNPDCTPGKDGLLVVELNDRSIFKGTPDCGILNSHSISPTMLNIGNNKLHFEAQDGQYLIDQITVKTELEETVQPTFYFDLNSDLFYEKVSSREKCGEIDGICPEECDEDIDKDCCFDEYDKAYWCDIKTDLLDDRCVGKVDSSSCDRCASGYEDKNGRPHDECEDLCGDDTDNTCPVGCSENYDQDCCFDGRSGDQYWCDDLPISGVDFTCVDSVTSDSCKYCTTGYDGEGSNPKCDYSEDNDDDLEDELKSGIHVVVEFKFTEKGDEKEAVFYINGHESGFETRDEIFTKQIDDYIEEGTNSLRLIPKSELDIREININIDD